MTETVRCERKRVSPIGRWVRLAEKAAARQIRHPAAGSIQERPVVPWRPEVFAGRDFCLLGTRRRDGTVVAVPVWFATFPHGNLAFRSGAEDPKVSRIRRDPAVLLAPCTFRGAPLAAPARGRAAIARGEDSLAAEAALSHDLGRKRRAYGIVRAPPLAMAYIVVVPS